MVARSAINLLRRTTRCIRSVCGLAGLTSFVSPGLGLAFSWAGETDGRVVVVNRERCVTPSPECCLDVVGSAYNEGGQAGTYAGTHKRLADGL